jgi:hypothetical protein
MQSSCSASMQTVSASSLLVLRPAGPANLSRFSQNFLTRLPPVEAKDAKALAKGSRVVVEGSRTASSVG